MSNKKFTMAECKELLEATVLDLGMSSDGIYCDHGQPSVLVNYVDVSETWAIDRLEITKNINNPEGFVKLLKQRHFQALRRLRDKIDDEITILGGTIDGPR